MKLFKIIKFAVTQPSTLVVLFGALMTTWAIYAKSGVCQAGMDGWATFDCHLNAGPIIIFATLTLSAGFSTYRKASASIY